MVLDLQPGLVESGIASSLEGGAGWPQNELTLQLQLRVLWAMTTGFSAAFAPCFAVLTADSVLSFQLREAFRGLPHE